MCRWQTGASSADWCWSSFQLCSLGLITSCFDSCLFAELLLVQELCSCSNRTQALLFTELLPPGSVLRCNASWDNQEGGRSERQAVSPYFCLSVPPPLHVSASFLLSLSSWFSMSVWLCWSFSVCLSVLLTVSGNPLLSPCVFLGFSLSLYFSLSLLIFFSPYHLLPVSPSLLLCPPLFLGGWVLGNRLDAILYSRVVCIQSCSFEWLDKRIKL